ncbi:flippase-like domain-containing protein [Halapricum hydrolyticum]|uniref:Flippase-like domain-containing protein n=1 Tax=Halapricum hydrolyticum TaxID=2979991 RepID=A0AAE3LFE3_9EURY|nr:flippase-like domain-containing protein [Halapricum hydrolyticum]MCU4718262.1 flippase-like domain-containing protein [Halapricum hydrolyticum]MCU4727290.1 flippase-like domain-containing protein [Halapricum hydrolyticum]
MDRAVEVSVVLPAYNEADTIERTVEVTLATLEEFLPAGAFEVIVAEDGCEDRTPEIATRLAADDERVRHVHSDQRLGRGGALEYAFRQARGETLAYFDTDLATDMSHLEELVESVRSDGYEFATGSRWIPGNTADRPPKRGIPSKGFNALVQLLLRSEIEDHQCGFKAFDRAALFDVLEEVEDDHWFWDTEVLVHAQRAGYDVKEFPVEWTPKGDSKVDLVRDVFGMGSQIVRTFWQVSVSPRIDRRVNAAVGTGLVALALVLMTTYLDPGEVWANMREADLLVVGVSALVYVLSWPLRGTRYRDILERLGYRSDPGFLTGAIFISQTGNLVFPARLGDAVRAYVMKARRSVPYPSGFASLAIERVFDLLTIAFLAGVVVLGMVMTMSPTELQTAIVGTELSGGQEQAGRTAMVVAAGVGVAAIVATLGIVFSARSDRNYVREAVSRLSSDSYADYVAGVIEQFAGDVQTVASDRRAFALVGTTSLLIWTIDVFTAVIVLAAFGVELTPFVIGVAFFAVSVGNLAKVLPLTPAGLGLYEGAFAIIVVGLTPIGGALAISVAIVDHAVKNLVTLAGGLVSMAWLNVSLTRAVEESEAYSGAESDRKRVTRE